MVSAGEFAAGHCVFIVCFQTSFLVENLERVCN